MAISTVLDRGKGPSLIGQTISRYRILERLGSGGMGIVYKAQDLRLGRFVALKLMPPHLSGSEERRRFLQEARAASALDHPNLCTVYEIDDDGDRLFIAMALYEGETLSSRLQRGPLKIEEAIDFAVQIAAGLAQAHSKGIVHRDIKPANLIVTTDGQVKIVDFGLARFSGETRLTGDGRAIGTASYISPEQLRGGDVDPRTDIWSLGVVLHEMIAGRRPFPEEAEPATFLAILTQAPEPLTALRSGVPLELDRIVVKAMAKDPADRYQHVDEIPVDLRGVRRSLSSSSSSAATPLGLTSPYVQPTPAPSSPSSSTTQPFRRRRSFVIPLLSATLALAAGLFAGLALAPAPPTPTFKRLTFGRGTIYTARFAPDGHTIVYGAAWDGGPIRIFQNRPESLQPDPVDLPPAEILSVSSRGEMAVSLGHAYTDAVMGRGTLARTDMLGGAPRPILEGVREADWTPDGRGLAMIRTIGGKESLESPDGKVLYETGGFLSHMRFSRDGRLIAFLDHPTPQDSLGSVVAVDLAGRKTVLSKEWTSIGGLAWSPDGNEIWFSAVLQGEAFAVYAVDLEGRERLVLPAAASLVLLDVSRDGKVLLARKDQERRVLALPPGEAEERNISWLDASVARDLSLDGRTALLTYFGQGSGPHYTVYARPTDGSPALRLGEGDACAISPDGRWAASLISGPSSRILLLPVGPGTTRSIPFPGIALAAVRWSRDGRRLVLAGRAAGRSPRCWVLDLASGKLRPVTAEGVTADRSSLRLSPDGRYLTAAGPDGKLALYPIGKGEPRPILGLRAGELPLRWTADGKALFVTPRTGLPFRIDRLDLATGDREPWKEIRLDPAGLVPRSLLHITPDGQSYVYSSQRVLTDLYLAGGLR